MRCATRLLVGLLALVLVLGVTGTALAAEQAKDASGKIASVDVGKNQFVLTDIAGKNWTFHCNAKTKIRLNNKDARLGDLKAGDSAAVRYEQSRTQFIAMEVNARRANRGP